MTPTEMRELMDVVYGQWPKEGSNPQNVKRLASLWNAALADMPFELAKRAVVKVLCTSPFFPKVSEIRSAALDLAQGQPILWGEAYQMIYSAVYNPCELPPLVAEVMAEIGDARSWRMETNQTARRAQFRQAYEAKVQQARDCALLPPTLRKELEAANERGRLPAGSADQGGTKLLPSDSPAVYAGLLQEFPDV